MVGDLVGVEAGALQHVLGGLEEGRRQVRVGRRPAAAADRPVERRAGLDGQLVGRDVLGAQRQRLAELGAPGARRLAGTGVDQVDRQAREDAAPRSRRRGAPRRRRGCGRGRPAPHRPATAPPATAGSRRPRRRRRSGRPRRRWDWPPASPRGRAAGSNSRRAAARISPAQSGSISEGVPPPRNTETSRRRPSRRPGASRSATMARASAAGPARVAPVAHHVEVAVGADAGAVGPVHVKPDIWEPDVARAAGGRLSQSAPPSAWRRRGRGG